MHLQPGRGEAFDHLHLGGCQEEPGLDSVNVYEQDHDDGVD